MVTMDCDFLLLATQGVTHAGIAYANSGRTIGQLIASIMLIYDVLTPVDMESHVEFLEESIHE